jgi:hypothetical protein
MWSGTNPAPLRTVSGPGDPREIPRSVGLRRRSFHQPCSISESSSSETRAPTARYCGALRSPLGAAPDSAAETDDVSLPQVEDLVVDLDPSAPAEDDVDLLLVAMPVAELHAEAGHRGLARDGDDLALERSPAEARLEPRREPEPRRRVLAVVDVSLVYLAMPQSSS